MSKLEKKEQIFEDIITPYIIVNKTDLALIIKRLFKRDRYQQRGSAIRNTGI